MAVQRHRWLIVTAALLITLGCAGTAAQDDEIAYTSGGVGAAAREDLVAQQPQYSLKLVFAYTNGDFLADVGVDIADADGNTILSAVSSGPWFLVKLPAGRYRVSATVGGTTQGLDVQVPAQGLAEHVMRWQPAAGGS